MSSRSIDLTPVSLKAVKNRYNEKFNQKNPENVNGFHSLYQHSLSMDLIIRISSFFVSTFFVNGFDNKDNRVVDNNDDF